MDHEGLGDVRVNSGAEEAGANVVGADQNDTLDLGGGVVNAGAEEVGVNVVGVGAGHTLDLVKSVQNSNQVHVLKIYVAPGVDASINGVIVEDGVEGTINVAPGASFTVTDPSGGEVGVVGPAALDITDLNNNIDMANLGAMFDPEGA